MRDGMFHVTVYFVVNFLDCFSGSLCGEMMAGGLSSIITISPCIFGVNVGRRKTRKPSKDSRKKIKTIQDV